MDQCYNALMNQLDWTDPEGDRCPYDLSKPLPLSKALSSTAYSFNRTDSSSGKCGEAVQLRLLNFKLGYNKDMPKIKWTENDQNQTILWSNMIDKP
ncbi:hypothetical protein Tco_1229248 [Tanacetum coccineum]